MHRALFVRTGLFLLPEIRCKLLLKTVSKSLTISNAFVNIFAAVISFYCRKILINLKLLLNQ